MLLELGMVQSDGGAQGGITAGGTRGCQGVCIARGRTAVCCYWDRGMQLIADASRSSANASIACSICQGSWLAGRLTKASFALAPGPICESEESWLSRWVDSRSLSPKKDSQDDSR